MLSFESDYTEGAHPAILEKFIETNMDQQSGYGVDVYSESARKKIAKACGKEDADIYFIMKQGLLNIQDIKYSLSHNI